MSDRPYTFARTWLQAGTSRGGRRVRLLSLVVMAAGCLAFVMLLLQPKPRASALSSESLTDLALTPAPATRAPDYSRFRHTNEQHARLPCLLCHRREDNSPRPVRSAGHTPCAGCHTQQFA